MKKNSISTYFIIVLFILVGIYLSSITYITPISLFAIRTGHGLLIAGILLILGKLLCIYRKRKTFSSVELLLSRDFGEFYFPPWIIKKKKNIIFISTDVKTSISMILGSVVACILVSYVFIPSFDDFINGIIEISLDTILMLLVSIYLLGLVFISINLFLLIRRIIKVIDKETHIIKIYRSMKLDKKNQNDGKKELRIPISNLKNSEIELRGYYQYLVPLDDAKGELELIKHWIYNGKYILIQSMDENFIIDLNSGIRKFLSFQTSNFSEKIDNKKKDL